MSDVVRALIDLIDSPDAVGEIFNIGSTQEITILDLAKEVLVQAAPDAEPEDRIVFIPYDEAYQPGFEDMQRRVPDIRKVRAAIGWEPEIALVETLQQVIDYYRVRM